MLPFPPSTLNSVFFCRKLFFCFVWSILEQLLPGGGENTGREGEIASLYLHDGPPVMDEVAVTASVSTSAAAANSSSTETTATPLHCLPLVSAFLAFAIAQVLKVFTTWFKDRRWDSKRLLGSGGMPSSHSATVTALAMAIGLQEGTGGSDFAIAVVLACIVMYDASGVRLHAGRQAELLNQIVCEFPAEHPLASVRPLRELLGHTPLQVLVGAVLGCIVAYLMRNTD